MTKHLVRGETSEVSSDYLVRLLVVLFLVMNIIWYYFSSWHVEEHLNPKILACQTSGAKNVEWCIRVLVLLLLYTLVLTMYNGATLGSIMARLSDGLWGAVPVYVLVLLGVCVLYLIWDAVIHRLLGWEVAKVYYTSDSVALVATVLFVCCLVFMDKERKAFFLGAVCFIYGVAIGVSVKACWKDMQLLRKLSSRKLRC